MKKLLTKNTLLLACALCCCLGCSQRQPRHIIGVSQCSEDVWREKQNAELRLSSYFQNGVQLKFAAAYDSDERQIEQIDSLVNSGIDLLIVAPNQVQTITPAIDRAYDKGIPVIVFERKNNSRKYTAFMSADNYEMGRQMGEYIVTRLKGEGRVLELTGLKGSSPAIERHKGFLEAVQDAPGIHVVASLQGDWTEETAYNTTRQWLANHPDTHIDLVFGANDRTAMGARRAFEEVFRNTYTRFSQKGDGLPLYCGIDGLPGKAGGIRLVRDSILDASYIYPTYGDRLLQLAVDILDGKDFQKEILMQSAIVTRDNANVLLMQADEIMQQEARLDQLHAKADSYLQELGTQRTITWLACGITVLLVIVGVLFYLYYIGKIKMRRERVVSTLWNLTPETEAPAAPITTPEAEEAAAPATTADTPKAETTDGETESAASAATSIFIARFKEVVESRMENSELSVEDLAADMNLSRVQLYRKVKSITGSTPVELLRTARLNRAYRLLLTTDRSVSEIAYQVGFTAPSYFTKCFKEEYGMLPGEVRNQ
jgi:ABC-type sugar transport system substrate-binding protein/AraC-like DNA-binding protein